MPSTASGSLAFEIQAGGENLNTWGETRLNVALQMLEAGISGLTDHALTANKSLTVTNFTLTDGTDLVHRFTSSSDGSYEFELTGRERFYYIINNSGFSQTITCSGGGDSVVIADGEKLPVYCDGTDVERFELKTLAAGLTLAGTLVMGGNKITGLGTPTDNTDGSTKAYVDAAVLDLSGGNLPSQGAGTRGAAIVSDGTDANWVQQIAGQRITTTQTLVANGQPYYCDVSGGAFTVTLPASPTEEDYVVIDVSSDATTNNLTVARNSETIEGDASDFTVDLGPRRYVFVYLNSDWKVV